MAVWTFDLAIDLPSANEHIVNGSDAATRARYKKLRDSYALLLTREAKRLHIPTCNPATYAMVRGVAVAVERAAVPTRWIELLRLKGKGQRDWDDDNLRAAFKAFRDAFQAQRLVTVTQWMGRLKVKGKIVRPGVKVTRQVLVAGAGIVWDDSKQRSRWDYHQDCNSTGQPGVRVVVADVAGELP